MWVLGVHDDVRVASKYRSSPAAVLCWTSTCWWVKRQNCVGRRPVDGLVGQAAVLCWTTTCCWVGGSSGSVVLDVDLLLGWRIQPQSGGLQAVQSCGARQVLITRDRQPDGPVVFNAQYVV